MKNRSNIRVPAAHSSIMSSKQLSQAHKCTFQPVCVFVCMLVYLYMSPCMYTCMYIYACECVCVCFGYVVTST